MRKLLLASAFFILLSVAYYFYFHKEKQLDPVIPVPVMKDKSIINVPDNAEGKG